MVTVIEQHQFNVERGPLYEGEDALPSQPPTDHAVKFIAYYLPQFHTIPLNDEAWGPGFTEWTNTTKALPRYVGHYQPRLPIDLSFYDLRSVETLERQAALAARGGVYGFCMHHYWFNGIRLLEKPLELLLQNPQIKLRFCLNWANESWTRRWDGTEHLVLQKQEYSPESDIAYARSLLPAVSDPRYICVGARPLIMLYRPAILPDAAATVDRWREVFAHEGLPNPYVVMSDVFGGGDPRPWGFDATAGFAPHNHLSGGGSVYVRRLDPQYRGAVRSYTDAMDDYLATLKRPYRYLPSACPNFDNEARKPRRGTGFFGSTPAHYGRWLEQVARYACEASVEERFVFINAWNEWAEGTYLEPDRHFGYAYLAETARVHARVSGCADVPSIAPDAAAPSRFMAEETIYNYMRNRSWTALRKATSVFQRG